jgi:hypothetical protein
MFHVGDRVRLGKRRLRPYRVGVIVARPSEDSIAVRWTESPWTDRAGRIHPAREYVRVYRRGEGVYSHPERWNLDAPPPRLRGVRAGVAGGTRHPNQLPLTG